MKWRIDLLWFKFDTEEFCTTSWVRTCDLWNMTYYVTPLKCFGTHSFILFCVHGQYLLLLNNRTSSHCDNIMLSYMCHASHFLTRECVISCYHVCVMLLISWHVSVQYHVIMYVSCFSFPGTWVCNIVIMCVSCFSFPATWVCNIMLSCVCHAFHVLQRVYYHVIMCVSCFSCPGT